MKNLQICFYNSCWYLCNLMFSYNGIIEITPWFIIKKTLIDQSYQLKKKCFHQSYVEVLLFKQGQLSRSICRSILIYLFIPLLKPGKPANKGPSYCPMSLLSPAVKILDALLLPAISEVVQLADHQHGFRKSFSTPEYLRSCQRRSQ